MGICLQGPFRFPPFTHLSCSYYQETRQADFLLVYHDIPPSSGVALLYTRSPCGPMAGISRGQKSSAPHLSILKIFKGLVQCWEGKSRWLGVSPAGAWGKAQAMQNPPPAKEFPAGAGCRCGRAHGRGTRGRSAGEGELEDARMPSRSASQQAAEHACVRGRDF